VQKKTAIERFEADYRAFRRAYGLDVHGTFFPAFERWLQVKEARAAGEGAPTPDAIDTIWDKVKARGMRARTVAERAQVKVDLALVATGSDARLSDETRKARAATTKARKAIDAAATQLRAIKNPRSEPDLVAALMIASGIIARAVHSAEWDAQDYEQHLRMLHRARATAKQMVAYLRAVGFSEKQCKESRIRTELSNKGLRLTDTHRLH
jgi:hypothetical protein